MTEKGPTLRDLIRAFRLAHYLAKGRYDRALAAFDRAIELNPEDAAAFVGRGEVYRLIRRQSGAPIIG